MTYVSRPRRRIFSCDAGSSLPPRMIRTVRSPFAAVPSMTRSPVSSVTMVAGRVDGKVGTAAAGSVAAADAAATAKTIAMRETLYPIPAATLRGRTTGAQPPERRVPRRRPNVLLVERPHVSAVRRQCPDDRDVDGDDDRVPHRLELDRREGTERADRRGDHADGSGEDVPAEDAEPREQQRGADDDVEPAPRGALLVQNGIDAREVGLVDQHAEPLQHREPAADHHHEAGERDPPDGTLADVLVRHVPSSQRRRMLTRRAEGPQLRDRWGLGLSCSRRPAGNPRPHATGPRACRASAGWPGRP